jgi:NADH pyrophosphatase NudC (nudix superfamily)
LGEHLAENPDLVFPPDWPAEQLPENGIQVNLMEYKQLYDYHRLSEKLRALHEKAAELLDVQKGCTSAGRKGAKKRSGTG